MISIDAERVIPWIRRWTEAGNDAASGLILDAESGRLGEVSLCVRACGDVSPRLALNR